jgi:TolB protein
MTWGKSGICLIAAGMAFGQAGSYRASKHGALYMWNYYFPPAPSTTPWSPAWSPDGRSIAVGMYGSIWKVDPQSGAATELTYDRKYHSSPAWSPDGKWIAYTADDDGKNIQLEILNVTTGESHALTSDDEIYVDPTWSPDGRRLCYVSTRPRGYFNIYVREIRDGRWAGEPVALTEDHPYPRDRLYFGAWDMHTQPAWTPDGKEIVFVSNRDVPLGSGDLWRMPAEANGMSRGRRILSEQTLYRTRPDVSIDGKRILYSSTSGAADEHNQLYVVPLAGGAPYKLTFDAHDHFHPRWSPDGEWIAYMSNEGGLPQLWLLETYGGARKKIEIARREWKRPMGQLRVRVVDSAAGRPTAARIYYSSPDGKFYPPAGAYARVGNNNRHAFHTEGEFTAEVPPGEMIIEAVKGFEYQPAETKVRVEAGRTASIEMPLRRITNMPATGWYSGSTHVHMNYGGNLGNTLPNMMMMSRAEDQHVLNCLVANKDNRILDWDQFVPGGGEHPISKGDPNLKVIVGEEYRPPFYGHIFLLGLRDHLISPFLTGYEGTGVESLYPSNTDIFRKATAQGAVTGYVHPFSGDTDPLERGLGVARGLPVDAALGTVNALEWSHANHAQLPVWFRALSLDLPLTPTGGEDSITNLHRDKLVGCFRTFVHVDGPLTAEGWLDGMRKGHTFFSSGPLMELRINGQMPGGTVRLPAGGGTIDVEARVWSYTPLNKVAIYSNGKAVRELSASQPFHERIPVTSSGWYSLYAEGPPDKHVDSVFPQAGTNAIRVYVGEQKINHPEAAAYFLRWIDKLQSMAEAWLWWRSDKEKKHIFAQFEEARQVYRKKMAASER